MNREGWGQEISAELVQTAATGIPVLLAAICLTVWLIWLWRGVREQSAP